MIKKEVINFFNNSNVLVTGGTGLIGRPLVDMLINAGANVTVVSLDDLKPNDGATYIKADLREYHIAQEVMQNIDYVFHLAGIKGSIDVTKSMPSSFFVPYLQFNTNVLEAARISKVKRVVYTSSIGAYSSAEVFVENEITDGIPMDMFPGWAKRMAEMQIRAYKIQYGLKNFSVVRPCNVYGIGDNFDPDNAMIIPSLMYKIASGDNPISVWGDGSAVRDFCYNKDCAEGILLSLYHMPDVDFLNLGSGIGYTISELLDTLHKFIDFNHTWDTSKSNGFPKRVMDITKSRQLIEFSPQTTLLEGLTETWNWFLNNKHEYLKRKNYFKEN